MIAARSLWAHFVACALCLLPPSTAAAETSAPERIAALAPHLVEMLYLLGAGDRIVVTVAHADHPPAARSIPRVGDAFTLSLEGLVAARPELVLAWGDALDGSRRARLETLVPELWVSEPRDLDAVADELERLARRLGTGDAEVAAFRARLAALDAGLAERLADRLAGAPPPRVLALAAVDPPVALGSGSFVDDLLERCGAVNALGAESAATVPLSREALLVMGVDHVLPLLPTTGREDLDRLLGPGVDLLSVDPDLLARPGPRLLDGAERLCADLAGRP